MAEVIISPIATKIIDLLASAALKQVGVLWGVDTELEELRNTISSINDVLLDAEEKQVHIRGIRNWLKRLEDLVYEADDLLDEFDTEALIRKAMPGNEMAKQVCTFFSSSNQVAFWWKMGHKIRELRKKLDRIGEDRGKFQLEVRIEPMQVVRIEREQTHSFVLEEEVVGRETDKGAILELLLEAKSDDNVSVIPIVGMGGLGKTTLAQFVYSDERVQKHFELKMWVCVPEVYDLKEIVRKIIKSATDKNPEDLELDQLQNDVRKQTDGKRYLLVLDDMWEESRERWLNLKRLLANGAEGSKIIVTTRSRTVAEITDPMKPYDLEFLDEERSWLLFKKVAFRKGQDQNDSSIVEIGMQIVKKCGGIPLAIRTIGSMLFSKDPKTEWSSFNKKEFSEISKTEDGDILPILKLSYDKLLWPLKRCFAYCSLFPKGYEFDKEILIAQWMAQGFLMTSNSSCLEDVGYVYFSRLLWRSFFQEVPKYEWENKVKFKMHDLMHDLAVSVSKTECVALGPNEENINSKIRHVSFDLEFNSVKQIPASLVQASRIRTILLPSQHFSDAKTEEKSICDAITSNFKFLRSLDLSNSGIKNVPKSIGNLKHLRYLDLSENDNIKALPNSVTKLQNLQTLKLDHCYGLRELPKGIKKLVNLRHLELRFCFKLSHMPHGLGQLTNLRTLRKFVLGESTSCFSRHCGAGELNELSGLNNLRGILEIEIRKLVKDAAVESRAANLQEKQHLESLSICWRRKNEFEGHIEETEGVNDETLLEGLQPHPNLKQLSLGSYWGVMCPSWLPSCTNLTELCLVHCWKWQHLPPLNQFNSLRILNLDGLKALEYISEHSVDDFSCSSLSSPIFFPSLEYLTLSDLPKLKGWWRDVVTCEDDQHTFPSFPRLSELIIRNCPQLTCMPLYPHLKEYLGLLKTSLKPFQQTVKNMSFPRTHKASPSTSSSFSYPLSQLRSLWIAEIDELQCLPDWLGNLTSLESLRIENCTKLKCLSPGIQHLISLRSLTIECCTEEFDMANDDPMTLQSLQSLRFLSFVNFPKLVALPEKIQYITSLQQLNLAHCWDLMVIPEWIKNLKSLKKLDIVNCPKLASLPEEIRSLTSLKTIAIKYCPILLERCRRQTGQDWLKIAHIPDRRIEAEDDNDSEVIELPNRAWVKRCALLKKFCIQ